jgi:hypothetical protein
LATDQPHGRSHAARALAERALARLAAQLGSQADHLVVIGGLVPAHLTAGAESRHLGTTDVDVVLPLALAYDRDDEGQDFGWLEAALTRAEFAAETRGTGGGGWRWWTTVDSAAVKVEFLCDVGTDPRNAPVPLPGCAQLSAMNLDGPRAALVDTVAHDVSDDSGRRVPLRRAGLAGYVLAKAAAAARRAQARDYYDFAYVLLHNDRGDPTQVAAAITDGPLAGLLDAYRPDLLATLHTYVADGRTGATAYAQSMSSAADVDPGLPYERHLEDATAAAIEFARALRLDPGPATRR